MTLAPDFPCLSPESADPDSVPLRAIVDELQRELHIRREKYPDRVRKGRMTAQEAEYQIDALAAIAADFAWAADEGADPHDSATRFAKAQTMLAPFAWSQLVSVLRREIAMRRRYYPEWIRAGTLDADAARHRIERFEVAHLHYWRWMRNFWPPEMNDRRAAGVADPADWAAHRLHRTRFPDHDRRGEYHVTPSTQPAEPEPELLLA